MSSHDEGETCQVCHVLHYDGSDHDCNVLFVTRQVGCRCEGCKAKELQRELVTLQKRVTDLRRTIATFATATATGDYQQGWKAMAAHLTIHMDALGLTEDQ